MIAEIRYADGFHPQPDLEVAKAAGPSASVAKVMGMISFARNEATGTISVARRRVARNVIWQRHAPSGSRVWRRSTDEWKKDLTKKVYVIEWYEHGIIDYTLGSGPAEAVTAYYDGQDAWCSPTDETMHDEFSVGVTELPDELQDEFVTMFEDMDAEERLAAFETMMQRHGTARSYQVDVVYTIEGARASVAGG